MNSKVFPKFAMFMDPLGVVVLPPISKKLLLVPLPKKQQVDIVQPFVLFQWGLERQSPD